MTRVDFYILPDAGEKARRTFAARLACKAFRQDLPVVVRTDDAETLLAMDDALWNVRPDAFLPHERWSPDAGAAPPAVPVLLVEGDAAPPEAHAGLLIDLCEDRSRHFPRYERVAEIVSQDRVAAGRSLYRYYRNEGYPLHHHDLSEDRA